MLAYFYTVYMTPETLRKPMWKISGLESSLCIHNLTLSCELSHLHQKFICKENSCVIAPEERKESFRPECGNFSSLASIAVINTTTESNLNRNRLIWLVGYSSQRDAKAGRNSRQELEAKTMEKHCLTGFLPGSCSQNPRSTCGRVAPSINT